MAGITLTQAEEMLSLFLDGLKALDANGTAFPNGRKFYSCDYSSGVYEAELIISFTA